MSSRFSAFGDIGVVGECLKDVTLGPFRRVSVVLHVSELVDAVLCQGAEWVIHAGVDAGDGAVCQDMGRGTSLPHRLECRFLEAVPARDGARHKILEVGAGCRVDHLIGTLRRGCYRAFVDNLLK